jgi:hypothetical protein
MNTINVSAPYKHLGMWVFDDPHVGLNQEPCLGRCTMIDRCDNRRWASELPTSLATTALARRRSTAGIATDGNSPQLAVRASVFVRLPQHSQRR